MLYIVHVQIDRDAAPQWEPWMQQHHIPEVLATGCFLQCVMARDEAQDTATQLGYRMTYLAPDADTLARYQRDHGPALQRDHTERYAGRFSARRELLPVLATLRP
jgi:hypothetical protein